MSRALLVITVALASYSLLNIAASIFVAAAWRKGLGHRGDAMSTQRARTLIQLRSLPVLVGVAITFAAVIPAFSIFEPERAQEAVGPLMLILAAIAAAQLTAALAMAASMMRRTRDAARVWLRNSVPLDVNPPAGVPAYIIDSPAPIVALVGVFKPKLVAARSVIDACTTGELNAIVAHERGHLHSRDNMKRWLMACAPDALRWTRIHHEIAGAWHDAAEDAADDAATHGNDRSRVDLAQLLVKIARLAPAPAWREATVSPFVEPSGLNRRVRRLLASGMASPERPHSHLVRAIVLLTAVAAASTIVQRVSLEQLYHAIEALIRFGR
jgi:BlaR1 peptidase M56